MRARHICGIQAGAMFFVLLVLSVISWAQQADQQSMGEPLRELQEQWRQIMKNEHNPAAVKPNPERKPSFDAPVNSDRSSRSKSVGRSKTHSRQSVKSSRQTKKTSKSGSAVKKTQTGRKSTQGTVQKVQKSGSKAASGSPEKVKSQAKKKEQAQNRDKAKPQSRSAETKKKK